ncbi:Cytochrome c oxidase subunit 6A1, mitochondrial [Trichoplax sp. H2]|nr:Cytochrome c oxidase subunit 6A1, mitochondrial [Trichoplax sp. H2]|eukprot:RDD47299.1 Cytochrome c oxidase subunit 6A1, mitochondrial [Trichoplax sp. H2]
MAFSVQRFIRMRTICNRQYATLSYKEELEATGKHAAETMSLWKKISILIALPAIAFSTVNAYYKETKHHKEHPHHPEFRPYPHLRIRSKPFPWKDGNHTLFHNPHVNALPEGYEESH